MEAVWSWLKYAKLSNSVPQYVTGLDDGILENLVTLKEDRALSSCLWDGSELPFSGPDIKQSGQPADQVNVEGNCIMAVENNQVEWIATT